MASCAVVASCHCARKGHSFLPRDTQLGMSLTEENQNGDVNSDVVSEHGEELWILVCLCRCRDRQIHIYTYRDMLSVQCCCHLPIRQVNDPFGNSTRAFLCDCVRESCSAPLLELSLAFGIFLFIWLTSSSPTGYSLPLVFNKS